MSVYSRGDFSDSIYLQKMKIDFNFPSSIRIFSSVSAMFVEVFFCIIAHQKFNVIINEKELKSAQIKSECMISLNF